MYIYIDELLESSFEEVKRFRKLELEELMDRERAREKIDEEVLQKLQKYENEYNNIENEYNLVIDAEDIKRDSVFLKALKDLAVKLLKEGNDVSVVISKPLQETPNSDRANYIYTDDEMEILNELNESLVKLGMKKTIGVDESSIKEFVSRENAWDFEDIVKANIEIDKVVNTILDNKLTPFEAMLYIHHHATQFKYTATECIKGFSAEESRSIVGFYKNDKIVCAGYASLVKSIVDKLGFKGYKGLECELAGCRCPLKKEFYESKSVYERDFSVSRSGPHCHNVIKIKDKKYSIAGYYIVDSTHDSKRKLTEDQEEEFSVGFAHCLYPAGDVYHFIYRNYEPSLSMNRFSNLMCGAFKIEDSDNLEEVNKKIKTRESHSKPIPFETYGKGLTAMWNKVGDLEKASSDYVAKELEKSIENSGKIFGAGASSEFVKLFVRNQAQKQNIEQSQEIGQKSNLQQKISKFVQKVIAKVKHEDKEHQEDNTKKL